VLEQKKTPNFYGLTFVDLVWDCLSETIYHIEINFISGLIGKRVVVFIKQVSYTCFLLKLEPAIDL